MCLVVAILAMKVAFSVAARCWWFAAAVLGTEALHRRPGFDQRVIHREMLRREQRYDLRIGQDCGQEAARNVGLQQPVAVLGEHRDVPDRHVQHQTDEPAEQHVISDLLHQLPF